MLNNNWLRPNLRRCIFHRKIEGANSSVVLRFLGDTTKSLCCLSALLFIGICIKMLAFTSKWRWLVFFHWGPSRPGIDRRTVRWSRLSCSLLTINISTICVLIWLLMGFITPLTWLMLKLIRMTLNIINFIMHSMWRKCDLTRRNKREVIYAWRNLVHGSSKISRCTTASTNRRRTNYILERMPFHSAHRKRGGVNAPVSSSIMFGSPRSTRKKCSAQAIIPIKVTAMTDYCNTRKRIVRSLTRISFFGIPSVWHIFHGKKIFRWCPWSPLASRWSPAVSSTSIRPMIFRKPTPLDTDISHSFCFIFLEKINLCSWFLLH